MKQKTSEQLKETLCRYLDDLASKDLNATTLDQIYKLLGSLKSVLKIEMLEDVSDDYGYSERGYSERRYSRDGGYSNDGGYSGARRGEHYVRGHYSRGYDDEMSHYDRRYSYADAKDEIVEKMHELADKADGKDREMIMRFAKELKNA